MPPETSKEQSTSSGLTHPLQGFGAVPLARETLDEVLSGYLRPGDKVSEWLREGALQPLRPLLRVAGFRPGMAWPDSRGGRRRDVGDPQAQP